MNYASEKVGFLTSEDKDIVISKAAVDGEGYEAQDGKEDYIVDCMRR